MSPNKSSSVIMYSALALLLAAVAQQQMTLFAAVAAYQQVALQKTKGTAETLSAALEHSHERYSALAQATVKIENVAGTCHGVLTSYQNEVIIVTAAHCLKGEDEVHKVSGTYRLPSWYAEPPPKPGHSFFDGFGYVWGSANNQPAAFTVDQIVFGTERDIGYIRGAPGLGGKDLIKRAVPISPTTPVALRTAYTTHWQDLCWRHEGGGCYPGELLVPTLGITRGRSEKKNFFNYSLPTYGGDSGSGIVDEYGQLIGIVNNSRMDKVSNPFFTNAVGPKTIAMFIESTWKQKTTTK